MYSAVRDKDGIEVVLKVYQAPSIALRLASAQNEFDVLRAIAGRGVPRALEVIVELVTPVLVLECVRGVTMGTWIASGLPPLGAVLSVVRQLAEVLERVHAARFLHCDVSPANVMVDPATLGTTLIDFGLARRFGSAERGGPTSSGGLAGTLLYIAPEQTGRMNRGTDFRSDLYSLGATLYQAFTGSPPFELSDPLELIHAHIARMPVPPVQLRPELPEVLSDLVLKLLRKEPDERYPSASVLRADIEQLQEQLERHGRIDASFILASTQVRDRPRFSHRLYGRAPELAALRALTERAISGLAPALLIQGEPGSGKSALVDQLRPCLADTRGYLAAGAFDPYRDRPYAAWEAALASLCQQLLIESDARLDQWRGALRMGLGNVAAALVERVPDLAFVLGEVPHVPALGPRETQARLSLAVQRFLAVCAGRGRPLVLFLDDLQWSDAGSLVLLEDLLCDGLPEGLLMIGACRSSDLAPGHPLTALLERLEERRIEIERLTLSGLPVEAGVEMLAEALERHVDDVRGIGPLVERRTANNPMLMRQFVEHIHARGLLHWHHGEGWTWDPSEIAAAEIPDGAVELMMEKIGRLDHSARALIEFASCVGDEFDIDLLAELGRGERAVVEQSVYALSDAGLIATSPNGFRFVHVRIREAAQSLLTEEARTQVHYDIARLLFARTPPPEQEDRAFAIVEHLNRGLPHLDEGLRLTGVRLNFSAGKRALASGDAATAESYFGVARLLLREDDWASERALGFELLLQSAYSALLRRDFEGALARLRDLDGRAPSILESTHIEIKRIQVFALTKPPEECTRYVLDVLRRHGIRWPLHPSALRTRLALYRVLWKLRNGIPYKLLQPAKHVDPRWLAPILITGVSSGVMTRVDARLVVLMACWIMDSNLRRGYVARPHFSLLGFAGLVHHVLGDARQAQRITQFAVDWLEREPDPAYRPRNDMQLHMFLLPWWTRRRQTLAQMDRVAEDMREMGDLEYAYYSRFLKIACCGLAGENVQKTDAAFGELADEVRRSGNRYPEPERCHAAYRFLVGGSDADLDLTMTESDAWIAANGGSAEVYIRTFWLLVLCVRGRYATALQQSDLSWRRLFQVVPYVHIADHTFLRGLVSAALATDALGAPRRRHLGELASTLKRLRRWAKHGPDFQHMAIFLEAEQAQLRGRSDRARSLYHQAAQRAREQEYLHHAALACERHARLLATLRRETEAAAALHDSIALYSQWGSQLKVDALAQQRQALLGS